MEFFEHMRRANADWYTANPLETMDDDELASVAAQAGLTVEELRRQAVTPHISMTCPLCGQPSTHLVNCKGCGGDAWGGEFVMAHGEDAVKPLRRRYTAALSDHEFSQEQIEHAAGHACNWGGCMICSECWHHTLPTNAYQICPIKLLADQVLEANYLPAVLFFQVIDKPEDQALAIARNWLKSIFVHWTETWNTVADRTKRSAIATWRHLLLVAFLEEVGSERSSR